MCEVIGKECCVFAGAVCFIEVLFQLCCELSGSVSALIRCRILIVVAGSFLF